MTVKTTVQMSGWGLFKIPSQKLVEDLLVLAFEQGALCKT